MIHILIVEDDPALNNSVKTFLRTNGYQATGCLNANDAYDAMYRTTFDLIISDIMMPGTDDFEFAKTVRSLNENIPILFVTALGDYHSMEKSFRAGVDDYMIKPVDLNLMLLRIGALLRRAKISQSKTIEIGNFQINSESYEVTIGGNAVPFSLREFRILFKLLSYPGKTFSREHLMEDFWEAESETTPRSVDVYMTKIRDKISPCEQIEIVTVRGIGYKAVTK